MKWRIRLQLGPSFLNRGVMVEYKTLREFLKPVAPVFASQENGLTMDGKKISIPALLESNRPAQMVRLTIRTRG